MNRCLKCGVEIVNSEKFCHNCGQPISQINNQQINNDYIKKETINPKIIFKELYDNSKKIYKNNISNILKLSFIEIGISLIIFLFNVLVKSIIGNSVFSFVPSLIINGFVFFGFLKVILKMVKNESYEIKDIFSETNMFLKYIIVTIITSFLVDLGMVLFIIPGIIVLLLFSQINYILLENKNLNIFDAIKKSIEMIKGYKFNYLIISIRLFINLIIGPFIICFIIFVLYPIIITITGINLPSIVIILAIIISIIVIIFHGIPIYKIAQAYYYEKLKRIKMQ